ncbi:hypothetical protein [Novispirillum itersonii]|uniref:hypothetical protein n=1 Tax=Novispirillum itersonii TaxID=189 RepID=UPI000361A90C|nr:hypothetical protein [Novispirillum itersonii]
MRSLLMVVMAALWVSACGDMPRPFDHTGDAYGLGRSPQLTRLATADSVTVVPPADLPDAEAHAVVAALIQALHQQETPARRGEGSLGYRLTAERQGATLLWSLTEPGGSVIAVQAQPWPSADVTAVVAALVPVLDADRERPLEQRMKVGAGTAPLRAPAEIRPVRVVVEGGAVSQQAVVLRRAMETALRQSRLVLTQDAAVPAVEVRGALTLGNTVNGGAEPMVPVAVVWAVVDGAGKEIGSARQENPVPKRLVDGSFPMLAVAIAQAGAGGVADLLDRVPGVERRRD